MESSATGRSDDAALAAARFPQGAVIADKYVVERLVAVGGMGVVLAATHRQLDQRVAIKVLHARFAARPETRARFDREARLAASLRSEHVVRIHDIGVTEDGLPFIVMEYLEGEDLGAVLARGPLATTTAVGLVLEACDALAEAHARGIVHRDLKPENLFLARRGGRTTLKIVDFGISKVAESETHRRLTLDDERFGTPLYMAPEQLSSSTDVDARTDLWALGVVLHELLTQRLPFEGHDLPSLIANVLTRPPRRLRDELRDTSPVLEEIVLRCLARDRGARPASVAELAAALAPFADAVQARAWAAPRPALAATLSTPDLAWAPARLRTTATSITLPVAPRRWPLLGVGAIVVVVAVGTASSALVRATRPATSMPAALVAPPPPVDELRGRPPAAAAPTTAEGPAPAAPTTAGGPAPAASTSAGGPAPAASASRPAAPVAPRRRAPPSAAGGTAGDYDAFGGRE